MIPRKKFVAILGILMVALSILGYSITIGYWASIDWNSTSYFWASPLISMIGTLCYFGVLIYDRFPFKRQKALWIMGFVWLGFDLIWFWMVDLK
jgi:hypothetical protein